MPLPQDVHILIPGTWNCVKLTGKRELWAEEGSQNGCDSGEEVRNVMPLASKMEEGGLEPRNAGSLSELTEARRQILPCILQSHTALPTYSF